MLPVRCVTRFHELERDIPFASPSENAAELPDWNDISDFDLARLPVVTADDHRDPLMLVLYVGKAVMKEMYLSQRVCI